MARAGTLALAHIAATSARLGLPRDRAGHEAFLAEIELRSGLGADAASAAAAQLDEGRAAARAAGGTLLAVGLHPNAGFGDVVLTDAQRYRRVESADARAHPAHARMRPPRARGHARADAAWRAMALREGCR